jgi:hypothetical protein
MFQILWPDAFTKDWGSMLDKGMMDTGMMGLTENVSRGMGIGSNLFMRPLSTDRQICDPTLPSPAKY